MRDHDDPLTRDRRVPAVHAVGWCGGLPGIGGQSAGAGRNPPEMQEASIRYGLHLVRDAEPSAALDGLRQVSSAFGWRELERSR